MTQQYDIVLHSQLGDRYGWLSWEEDGCAVCGILSLLGFENPVHGQKAENRLELIHDLHTAVSTLACRTALELRGETLCGMVNCAHGSMKIFGRKKKAEKTETENTQNEI